MSEWIDVVFMLPEKRGTYIAFDGKVGAHEYRPGTGWVRYSGENDRYVSLNSGITHWMPMPDAPQH